MKRIFPFSLIVAVLISLCACSRVEISGIENYRRQTCSVSLTEYLFPSDDFLTKFKYENGGYEYCDTGDLAWGYVTTLCHLSYEYELYNKAKEFCLSEFSLCDNHQYEYNCYQFSEVLCHRENDGSGNRIIVCDYPSHFNMFAFNDEKCELIFIGYYNGDPDDPEKALAEKDFCSFLRAAYDEYYVFEE